MSAEPPQMPPPHPPEELFTIGFNERIEQIRAEIAAAPAPMVTPPRRSFAARSQRYLPIVFILAWLGISTWMYVNPLAGQSVFVIGDPVVNGLSELCPGESLDFTFSVNVGERGVFLLDMSTWRVEPPPATIVFSERDIMVIGDDRSFPITRKWVVPARYQDPATNEYVEWQPGKYTRDISVTASGRNTNSSTRAIPFSIREDCTDGG